MLESLGFRRFVSAAAPATPPKRLIFLGFGWGITESTWYPDIKQPGGGAGLKLGHNIVAPKDTPLCNAWLTLLHGIGVQVECHGDSTGVLNVILA